MTKKAMKQALEASKDLCVNYAITEVQRILEEALKQSKPLTDEEIRKFQHHVVSGAYQHSFIQGVRYAESAHGIKE